ESLCIEQGDAMVVQGSANLPAFLLPPWRVRVRDAGELGQAIRTGRSGPGGPPAALEQRRQRSEPAQRQGQSVDSCRTIHGAAPGTVALGEEYVDIGRVSRAVMPELGMLDDQRRQPIQIGDHPSEESLDGGLATGPCPCLAR